MAPKRLSNPEKQSILQLYRQPTETTSTLAARFGVSSSTISRVLKQGLSTDEYEALVQQKRTGVPRPFPAAAPDPLVESSSEGVAASRRIMATVEIGGMDAGEVGGVVPPAAEAAETEEVTSPPPASTGKPGPVLRKRSKREEDDDEGDRDDEKTVITDGRMSRSDAIDNRDDQLDDDDDDDDDEFQDDLDADDDYDDDDDDSDDDDNDDDSDGTFTGFQVKGGDYLDVRPITEAQLPRTCYLVIDRAAELITRPLSDFADLGRVPSGEIEEKTLPVFDNHRIAKRFSNRRFHRIVKIPDSRLLVKTTAYLQAKGITRLLFDGQVYALSSPD